jgi:hypothetical protein
MGTQIIKVAPGLDLYLEWSSVVDAPTAIGTRAEMAEHLNTPRRGQFWMTEEQVERLLRRADETGSSAYLPLGCTWGKSIMYQQDGTLSRAHLAKYAARLLDDIDAEPTGLLEPFEALETEDAPQP